MDFGRLLWDVRRFLNGDQNSPTVELILRQGGRFALGATWNYCWIDTRGIAPLYRTPVCINVSSKEVYVGR